MSQVLSPPQAAAGTLRPLCVDLDGTLVKSDTLVDSLLLMARSRPQQLLKLPGRLLHGKAAFKAFVTKSVRLDVAHLPYNRKVLQLLEEEHRKGRPIYLATGANEMLARRVAGHFGFFAGVLGSGLSVNLTGKRKLEAMRRQLGDGGFDYIGNDTPDLPLLATATETMVANPTLRLRMKMRARGIKPARQLNERGGVLRSIASAMRPHQWAKNVLVVVPLLLSHVLRADRLADVLLAFLCFSLVASSAYIVNDLLDIEADRCHPRKRYRPFAAGELSAFTGICLAAAFLITASACMQLLPAAFSRWLLLYLFATLAYSLYLKRIAIVDVIVLSGLYTLRLLAGGAATHTPISHWLAGFAVFLFFSLAIVKRFAELENLRASGARPRNGRGYIVADLNQLRSFGTSSAFAAVMVFAIYISGPDVTVLYRRPEILWLTVPFMILWLCRLWLLASRGELNEDPLVFALTDRASLLIGISVAMIVLLASRGVRL